MDKKHEKMFHLFSNQGKSNEWFSNENQMGTPFHTHHVDKIYFKIQTSHFGETVEN